VRNLSPPAGILLGGMLCPPSGGDKIVQHRIPSGGMGLDYFSFPAPPPPAGEGYLIVQGGLVTSRRDKPVYIL
jgi:hypothetical protein